MKLLSEFAIQLYSVRDAMENDYVGVLEKLGCKGFGYTGVEFYGYGGLSAGDMKRVLNENGLKPIGTHVGIDDLLNNLDEEIEYNKFIGTQYIICPNSNIETKAETLAVAEKLSPIAEKVTAAGIKFGYHNHAHEFVTDDGEYLLDILFNNLPKETVMELDVFWSKYADVDTLAYMEKHRSRIELIHVKQIGNNKKNVELNKGLINFAQLITKAKTFGIKHFVLEQEEYETTSIASAENAITYINSLEDN